MIDRMIKGKTEALLLKKESYRSPSDLTDHVVTTYKCFAISITEMSLWFQ